MSVQIQSCIPNRGPRRIVTPSMASRAALSGTDRPDRVVTVASLSDRVPDGFIAEALSQASLCYLVGRGNKWKDWEEIPTPERIMVRFQERAKLICDQRQAAYHAELGDTPLPRQEVNGYAGGPIPENGAPVPAIIQTILDDALAYSARRLS